MNSIDTMKDILKKAFDLTDIQEMDYVEGIFAGKAKKFIIPEKNLTDTIAKFPFIKHAVTAGLIGKDKQGNYFTTEKILEVRSNDKKAAKRKQFFSINGDDKYERTTLYDGLVTLTNLKFISSKFGIKSDEIKFSIRYENGNDNKIVNFVQLDKRLFGNNDEEIVENVEKMNKIVKYERPKLNEEAHA